MCQPLEVLPMRWTSPTPTAQAMKGSAHLHPGQESSSAASKLLWVPSPGFPSLGAGDGVAPSSWTCPCPAISSCCAESAPPRQDHPPWLHPPHEAVQSNAASPSRAVGGLWLPHICKETIFTFPCQNTPSLSLCFDSTASSWLNCTQQNRAVDLCVSLLSLSYSWGTWS